LLRQFSNRGEDKITTKATKAHKGRDSTDRTALGQLLVIGFDGTEMSAKLGSLLQNVQPAGVILFARNIVSSEQTYRLLKDCQAQVDTPLFRCVDLEGGTVDRLRNVIGPAPSPAEVFATGDRKLFRKHGRVIGENCRALGFNVDFAPVVDLAFEASKSVMSSRAVSDDPRETITYVREFLTGLGEAGVLGCGKHFPGLGEGTLDSHHELPVIEKSWKKLWEQDLVPYRLLRRKFPFVMVSHAAYPKVTRERTPASLSPKWITDVLRKKIGYRGLIASDDLEMGGVLGAAPIEQAAVQHIRAGGDLCLVCHQAEFVTRAHSELVRETQRDRRFASRAAEGVGRVLAFKKNKQELRRWAKAPTPELVERLSRRLWEFNEQVRLGGL
jgi:beta-N-acetylhexosaminidase